MALLQDMIRIINNSKISNIITTMIKMRLAHSKITKIMSIMTNRAIRTIMMRMVKLSTTQLTTAPSNKRIITIIEKLLNKLCTN